MVPCKSHGGFVQFNLVVVDPSKKGVFSTLTDLDLIHHWRQFVGDHVGACPTWEEFESELS